MSTPIAGLSARIVSDREVAHSEMPETHKISKSDRLYRIWHRPAKPAAGSSDKSYEQLDSDIDSIYDQKKKSQGNAN